MKTVLATGCFDVLHAGHVALFKAAREFGDYLIVGINSDASVRALKGIARPINNEHARTVLLRELRCVDAVQVFEEENTVGILQRVRPAVWVKGQDYTLETLNPQERQVAESLFIEIRFVPVVSGYSTTNILTRQRDSIAP